MPALKPQASKYDVIARVLELMDSLSEEQQFFLFWQLLGDSLSRQVLKRVMDMTDTQRLALLGRLQELTAMPAGREKRRHPRKECLINVDFRLQGPRFSSYILDINPNGAFIETGQRFSVGQKLKLSFASPGTRKPLNIAGRVIWTAPRGIGIKFSHLKPRQLEAIKSFSENAGQVYKISS